MKKRKNPFGKGHNSLFRPGPNWTLNACVGKNKAGPGRGFDRYARGYFEGAACILKCLQQDNSLMVDRLVYPLVSLYRHGAELALKHLAQVLPRACEETGTFKSSHRITDNWEIVRRCMKKLGAPAAELSQIEDLLKKLVEIDPDSMVFRYPEDKSGSAHLKDTTHINVEVFGSEMAALVPFFESACDWADAIHDMKLDAMEAMGHERPDY